MTKPGYPRAACVARLVLIAALALLVGAAACVGRRETIMAAAESSRAGKMWVYVGTYTGGKSKGIYRYDLDLGSGKLTSAGLAAELLNPSFLAVHPNRRFLYAVNEVESFKGQQSGAVSAFALDPKSGKLTFLNEQSTRGEGPCHLVVDREGKNVLVANYSGGSTAVLPLAADGRLKEASAFIQHTGSSVNRERQEGPHAHSANVDPSNRFAFVADLGLDKVMIYRFDAAHGTLSPGEPSAASVTPGAGPRHFAFHPNGRFAYVINEMGSTVTAFRYDARKGELTSIQTISTLPAGFTGSTTTAEVQVHPSGRFLYGSNRGHDSIAIFTIDPETGKLTAVGHQPTQGKTPRNFGIDPTGTYLIAANQDSDTLVVFRIDRDSGRLHQVGEPVEAPKPVCVNFVPVE
jgi:6-phosphogluconolactonase